MSFLSEILGVEGAFETLQFLEKSSESAVPLSILHDKMVDFGVVQPEYTSDLFFRANVLSQRGGNVALTTFGIRTFILLEALNGEDLLSTYEKLRNLDTSLQMYELVRQGMTRIFIESLISRPGFHRLYICSPWINPDEKSMKMLIHAVLKEEEKKVAPPEIIIITRPEEGTDWDIPESLDPFLKLNSQVLLNKRLHSKLYVREPGANGGLSMAIVGSQNLTRSNYLELGIKITNDNQIINQLIRYTYELMSYSKEP